MAEYSIKDVEILSGIKAHTLRIWEQRYEFLTPHRTDTNIRYYNDEQLKHILNIALLNKNGFKISRIADMSHERLRHEVMRIAHENHEPDTLLDSMIHAMIDFDEARFEKTLNLSIMKNGFEDTFLQLIFPFLQRTGILWATGTIKPVQEHFISNLIRRKLCVAIDNQFITRNENTKKWVLFLPEGEWHELLLLFTEYLLRKNNQDVAYIGCSLPAEDLASMESVFKPNYLVTFITTPTTSRRLHEFIRVITELFSHTTILIGGAQIVQHSPTLPSNVAFVKSVKDLMEWIKK